MKALRGLALLGLLLTSALTISFGMRGGFASVLDNVAVDGASAATLNPDGASPPTLNEETPTAATATIAPSPSRVTLNEFFSPVLNRTVKYNLYIPRGYDTDTTRRYPVLYYLHGMSGSIDEWLTYGTREAADQLMSSGTIQPFLIVMPEGDQGYWVDQVDDGPQWATYLATDVVNEIDSHYRTIPLRADRAIGGISMGAHGALQIALNHPDIFSIVGAHSPSFRARAEVPAYFGNGFDFARRDPPSLFAAHPEIARSLNIWLDFGYSDYYGAGQARLEKQLVAEGIPHQFHQWDGGHEAAYWTAHNYDYLRFYSAAFAGTH